MRILKKPSLVIHRITMITSNKTTSVSRRTLREINAKSATISLFTLWAALSLVTPGQGSNMLWSTGVNDNSQLLPGGSLDSHYTVGLEGSGTNHAAVVMSTANYWPSWVTSTTGQWLYTSDSSDDGSRGWYDFITTFTLTGDPSSASISGQWTCDNYGSILLNGNDTGNSLANNSYFNLYNFQINSGFQSGTNVLEFRVYFPDGYDGLLVSSIALTTVPEPATITMLILGTAAAFGYRHSRNRGRIFET
jgi:hypothetical protein